MDSSYDKPSSYNLATRACLFSCINHSWDAGILPPHKHYLLSNVCVLYLPASSCKDAVDRHPRNIRPAGLHPDFECAILAMLNIGYAVEQTFCQCVIQACCKNCLSQVNLVRDDKAKWLRSWIHHHSGHLKEYILSHDWTDSRKTSHLISNSISPYTC